MRDVEILRRIAAADAAAGRTLPVVARDFVDADEPARVRRALARLAARGTLEEVVSGVWRRPAATPPRPTEVADAVARRMGWRQTVARATAANAVGLSAQVPAVVTRAVDRPWLAERVYAWPAGRCLFEPAPGWLFDLTLPSGRYLAQALRWTARDGAPTADPAVLADALALRAESGFHDDVARDAARFPDAFQPHVRAVLQRRLTHA